MATALKLNIGRIPEIILDLVTVGVPSNSRMTLAPPTPKSCPVRRVSENSAEEFGATTISPVVWFTSDAVSSTAPQVKPADQSEGVLSVVSNFTVYVCSWFVTFSNE